MEIKPEEQELRERVKAAHQLSNGSAGARSIARMVTTDGLPLSRYRAARRMKVLGLVSSQQPAHRYKKAEQPHVSIPNRLDRQFTVEAPNKVWAGDITYVWTGKRWAYLAMVIDLFARKPVGWALPLTRNEHWFVSLVHARVIIEACRREYNEERPKKALGGLTPVAHARKLAGKSATVATGL